MNASNAGGPGPEEMGEPTPEEIMKAIFANMVMQNGNMALMFLGKVPHPQTGKTIKDLESAQMFIDQVEMLAYKTRGNLDEEEKALIQQSLVSLRMAFVEELRNAGVPLPEHLAQNIPPAAPEKPAETPKIEAATPSPAPAAAPAPEPAPAPAPTPADDESRKRFSKKY